MDQEASNNLSEVPEQVVGANDEVAGANDEVVGAYGEAAGATDDVEANDEVAGAIVDVGRATANVARAVDRDHLNNLGTLKFPSFDNQASEAARLKSFHFWPKGKKHVHCNQV